MQVADYAKKKYNAIKIPTSVDGKNADREVKTIMQSLQDYADRNKRYFTKPKEQSITDKNTLSSSNE